MVEQGKILSAVTEEGFNEEGGGERTEGLISDYSVCSRTNLATLGINPIN